MLKNFIPNKIYDSVYDIDYDFLIENYSSLFIDFDNTLMPWNSDYLDVRAAALLNYLLDKQIKVIIASNGKTERIESIKLKDNMNIDIIGRLKKPLTKNLKTYINDNNIDCRNSVFIGDNLITDIYTANRLGMFKTKTSPSSSFLD